MRSCVRLYKLLKYMNHARAPAGAVASASWRPSRGSISMLARARAGDQGDHVSLIGAPCEQHVNDVSPAVI